MNAASTLSHRHGLVSRCVHLALGYDSDAIRDDLERRGADPVIPTKSNRRVQRPVDKTKYALRNRIERFFNRLKQSRRIATRYDKLGSSFLGFVQIATIRQWIRIVHTTEIQGLSRLSGKLSNAGEQVLDRRDCYHPTTHFGGWLPMFDIKDIEIVSCIVRHGGFRAAAAQMRLSQSAVSARIAALEDRLGVELFDRRKRRGRLSPAGRTFLDQTARLTEMRDRIMATLGHEGGFAGTIRIGVAETVVHTWLPGMMTRIRDRFPNLRIELAVDTSSVLAAKLLQDDLDIAVLMEEWVPAQASGTFIHASIIDWFAAATTDVPDHPLTLKDLARHPIVTFPKGTIPYRNLDAIFTAAHLDAAPLLHGCASLSTALHLVGAGFGIGVLPSSMAAADIAAGRIRRLDTVAAAKPKPLRFVLAHHPSLDADVSVELKVAAEQAVAAMDNPFDLPSGSK
ncbi:hypothetical protein LCGC14_0402730 [marine sediment metagenome]|uniref:HTH lysR-type domain-containing protein n=1 Tax=marine sediment metagenome TaxID=412755 RepID=A0A0F9W5K4_9ZZZZ